MKVLRFGKVQLRIMQVLWEKERANAREITDALNKIVPIAHSTVQTLLRKLEEKGAVDHDIDYRTFIFYPLIEEEKATKHALKDLIDRVFSGSPSGLVSFLVKHEKLSPDELKKIREMIGETEKF
ncbi:BlaI/MecI/CopY family transcriptional regulator [Candidatus Latescibacterota bacterium]